jgi:hypothetical protein
MSEDHDHDRDPDRDRKTGQDGDHGPDPGTPDESGSKALAPALMGSTALKSVADLGRALNAVDTTDYSRTGLPMMLFKARENNGTWGYGLKRIVPEEGSQWAVFIGTFKRGYICFPTGGKPIEHMVPVHQPMPDITKLSAGYDWQKQWSVQMRCISDGADAGVEVVLKATTDGGLQAVVGLSATVRDRINGGEHVIVTPVLLLKKDSYIHGDHGKTGIPVLTVARWVSIHGTASASPPPQAPPPAEPARRRRVA